MARKSRSQRHWNRAENLKMCKFTPRRYMPVFPWRTAARMTMERRWKHRLLYVRNTSGLAHICARPTSMLITGEQEPSLTGQRSTG